VVEKLMTPTDLAAYTKAMKDLGVSQFSLRFDHEMQVTDIAVAFSPALPAAPEAFTEPEPGGWKAATGPLDAPLEGDA
jgi:hypothetical protein